jgi:hypothetical protein
MIRLVLLLCGSIYFALMVLGEDHGQKRYGLMLADQQPKPALAQKPTSDEVVQAVFIPAQTVMEPAKVASVAATAPEPPTPETTAPASEPDVTLATADVVTTPPLPEPEIPGGTLFTVASRQVNVREGPGKNFSVVGSLTKGEQVLVVQDENPVEGWSKVRMEGDGIEGYVASYLLVE